MVTKWTDSSDVTTRRRSRSRRRQRLNPAELGASERIRTDGLPFTRSTGPVLHGRYLHRITRHRSTAQARPSIRPLVRRVGARTHDRSRPSANVLPSQAADRARSVPPSCHIVRAPLERCPQRPRAVRVVGDVHACFDELCGLLSELGYEVNDTATDAKHVGGRRVIFLGDLVDRGPESPAVLRLVMGMVPSGRGRGKRWNPRSS